MQKTKLSPKRQTIMEKERQQRLAARPENDFLERFNNLAEDKVYNVSNFTSLGRGARPILKTTAEKAGYYSIPEVPQLVSDNRLTLELALKNLDKWNSKIERSVEAAFGAKKTSPKKASTKKTSPKKASTKKTSPEKASTKKTSPKKASTKKTSPEKVSTKKTIPEKTRKQSPKGKEKVSEGVVARAKAKLEEEQSHYQVEVKGNTAKISPRKFNYKVTDKGFIEFQ